MLCPFQNACLIISYKEPCTSNSSTHGDLIKSLKKGSTVQPCHDLVNTTNQLLSNQLFISPRQRLATDAFQDGCYYIHGRVSFDEVGSNAHIVSFRWIFIRIKKLIYRQNIRQYSFYLLNLHLHRVFKGDITSGQC